MKHLVRLYINSWWIPTTSLTTYTLSMYMLLVYTNRAGNYQYFFPLLCIIGIMLLNGMVIAGIYNLYKQRWFSGLVNTIVYVLIMAATLFFAFGMVFLMLPIKDHVADNFTIPTNMQVSKPIINKHPEYNLSPQQLESSKTGKISIALWEGLQPGIYHLVVWSNPGESGTMYIKAYEVTHNLILSDYRLEKVSTQRITGSRNPNQLFLYNRKITIYEGDWGKPYAARLEVWFHPDNGSHDRKLIEKVYEIQGWQR